MSLLKLMRSAPVRYALAFAALSTLAMGVLLAFIYWSMISLLERHLRETIEQQFEVLRDDYAQDGREALLGLVRQHAAKRGNDPLHLLVQDPAGKTLAGDLPSYQAVEGWQNVRPPRGGGGDGDPGRTLRGRGERMEDGTFVLVALDTRDLRQTRALIVRSFSAALGATILLALGGGFLIGAGLLRRVDRANRAAGAIMSGDLSRRLPVAHNGDEFDRLAEGLNRMLARIEELMENLRHVSSGIAHDLRTPLGRLRQRLEACRIKPRCAAEYEAAIDGAIEDADTIIKTFDAMLRIAQVEAGVRRERFARVDLKQITENVVEAYAAVAEDDGRVLELHADPDATVSGDQELLTQILANLIENSLRHTPVGTRVKVRVERAANGARLSVSDDGPGIPAEERERVFRRFFRLDASRSTPGSGLGLSLVGAVAKLHDATISLEDNSPGLRLTIAFPHAP